MDAREVLGVRDATVCVVRYRAVVGAQGWYNFGSPPANSAVLHQVCLRADKVSGCGDLVRLGETAGDELSGWQWIDALDVVEVLGEAKQVVVDGVLKVVVTPLVQPAGADK